MTELISIEKMIRSFRIVWKRFPSAVLLWALSLLTVVLSTQLKLDDNIWSPIIIGESLAFLSSLLIEIWYGGRCIKNKTEYIALAIIISVIYALYWADHQSDANIVGVASIITLLMFALVFVPSFRNLDSKMYWKYSMRQISNLIEASVISWILLMTYLIIWFAIETLFGLRSESITGSTIIILCVFVPVFYCMVKIPVFSHNRVRGFVSDKLLSKFALYILSPAVLVYTVILYTYGVKILVHFDLPRDSICTMVSGLIFVVLLSIYGLKENKGRIAHLFSRAMPVVMLPLLVMMSVAIGYRVGQYGLSANRLYIILINIWSYFVLVALILRPKLNLNKVAISIAVVFFLVSAIPGFNINAIAFESDTAPESRITEREYKTYVRQAHNENTLIVPEGAKSVEYVVRYSKYLDDNTISLKYADCDKDLVFKMPVDSLIELDSLQMSPVVLHALENPEFDFVMNYVKINTTYNSVDIKGFVIQKNK